MFFTPILNFTETIIIYLIVSRHGQHLDLDVDHGHDNKRCKSLFIIKWYLIFLIILSLPNNATKGVPTHNSAIP